MGKLTREEQIENGFKKTVERLHKMQKSRRVSYVKDKVRINEKLVLLIECIRNEVDCILGYKGVPYCFQVYAIVNGNEVDCTSDHGYIEKDIRYLLECYI